RGWCRPAHPPRPATAPAPPPRPAGAPPAVGRFARIPQWHRESRRLWPATVLERARFLARAFLDRNADIAHFGQRLFSVRIVVPRDEAEAERGEGGDARNIGSRLARPRALDAIVQF